MSNETGEMKKWPISDSVRYIGLYSYNSYDWETLDSFFKNHDIVPIWMNCHYTWGVYDEEAGKWTGAVGKVW